MNSEAQEDLIYASLSVVLQQKKYVALSCTKPMLSSDQVSLSDIYTSLPEGTILSS